MKKTLSINLGGRAFTVEEQGYALLDVYLAKLKTYFAADPSVEELVADIEFSMADKFSEKIGAQKQVVTEEDVQEVIGIMGDVAQIADEDAGEKDASSEDMQEASEASIPKRLYRDTDDVVIAGVCSGLAAYFGIDPVVFRIAFGLLALVNGIGILLYFILWASMPAAVTSAQKLEMRGKPTNLNEIQELMKEKAQDMKREGERAVENAKNPRSTAYKILNAPIQLVGMIFIGIKRIVLFIVPVLAVILGVFVLLGSMLGMAVTTAAAAVLTFQINSPYLVSDLPLADLAGNPLYYVGIASVYFLVIVPLIFAVILGMSLLRRKNQLRAAAAGLLGCLWLFAIAGASVSGTEIVPLVHDRVSALEARATMTRSFAEAGFTKVHVQGNTRVELKPGSNFAISFTGDEKRLNALRLTVKDGELLIDEQDVK